MMAPQAGDSFSSPSAKSKIIAFCLQTPYSSSCKKLQILT